jgi:hypothetical protein
MLTKSASNVENDPLSNQEGARRKSTTLGPSPLMRERRRNLVYNALISRQSQGDTNEMAQVISWYVHGVVWPWLFPAAYLIHLADEYWGSKPESSSTTKMTSFDLTSAQFLVLNAGAMMLLIFGILLAQKLRFPQLLMVILGTAVLANASSHTFSFLVTGRSNPGLVSGLLIFAPLGGLTLISLAGSMGLRRYLAGIALGLVTQVFVSLLASKGSRLFGG